MDKKLKNWVINLLRNASFKWKPRGAAEKKFRVPNGLFKNGNQKFGYLCNKCKNVFMKKDTVLDHIEPVVPMDGFSSFDDFIERLFCDEANFQVMCIKCHDEKSAAETQERKRRRSLAKKE